jgi:hypothetical protein
MARTNQKKAAPAITLGKGQVLRVRAEKDGYRRGGVPLTKAGVDFAEGKFSAEQLEAWQDDPRVTLSVIDVPKPKGEGE